MTGRARRVAVVALVVVASLAILLAVLVGYVRRAAVDSDQFANRATLVLLAKDWNQYQDELMQWQKELLREPAH